MYFGADFIYFFLFLKAQVISLTEYYTVFATRGRPVSTESQLGVSPLDKVSISPCAGVPKNEARKQSEADIFSRVSATGNLVPRAPGLGTDRRGCFADTISRLIQVQQLKDRGELPA